MGSEERCSDASGDTSQDRRFLLDPDIKAVIRRLENVDDGIKATTRRWSFHFRAREKLTATLQRRYSDGLLFLIGLLSIPLLL